MEQTRREEIISMLQEPCSLKGLSRLLKVPLKVIEDDLNHIEKSLASSHKLKRYPPECQSCGFVFQKRERINKPSRCPQCKSEHISEGMVQLVTR